MWKWWIGTWRKECKGQVRPVFACGDELWKPNKKVKDVGDIDDRKVWGEERRIICISEPSAISVLRGEGVEWQYDDRPTKQIMSAEIIEKRGNEWL